MDNDRVNDRVQKKLIDVIKNNRNGLWCCELPEKYYGLHKSEFDFRCFGYTSLIEMVLELPKIFRCYQPSLGDWILYDASSPISKEEEELERSIEKSRKDHIPNSLKIELKKLLDVFEKEIGKNIDEVPHLYYQKFKKKLDFEILGFTNLLSFFKSLEGDMVHLRKVEKSVYVLPLKSKGNVSTFQDLNNLGEAVPPILPGDDLFLELFPENAFGPNETIPKLQIEKYLEIGSVMAMQVADVWTPHKFYVQLTEFEKERNQLIHDLENFYNEKSHKYKMPEVTVQPNQICAVNFRYKNTVEKWHRAEVIKILKNGKVSVRLIDYGRVVPVKYNALRFLPRKFGDLPRSAIPAALANLEPVSSSKTWSDPTNKRFLELVTSSWLIMEVVDLDDKESRVVVRLYDAMNETLISFNEILIEEGNACFSEELLKFCKQEIKVEPKKKGRETKETGIKDTISNENYNLLVPSDQCENSSIMEPIEAAQAKESRREKTTSNEDNSDQCKINSSLTQPVEANQAKESRREKTTSNEDHSDECKTRPQPIEATKVKEARMQETTSTDSHSLPINQFGIQTLLLPTENVEAWKTLIYQQQLFQQMQKQALEEKLKINRLAIHFFSTHPDIKNLSQLNPELGLRLATNLAKSYLENIKPVINL